MSLKELNARWKAESPILFKRIQKLGVSLMAAGGTAILPQIAIPANIFEKLHWPGWIETVAGYMVVAGFCIGVVSKLTCQDPTDITKPTTP